MTPASYRYIACRTEQEILVLTITAAKIQDDEMGETLGREFLAAVAQTGLRKVVIDFQNTKYMSSVAFRPLLLLRQHLRERGGRMMLCGLSPIIGDVFYTTRLASSSGASTAPFQLEPDVAAAIARLNQPGESEASPPKD